MVSVIEKVSLSAVAVSVVLPDFHEITTHNPKALHYYGKDSTVFAYSRLIKTTIDLIHDQNPELLKYAMAFTFDEHTNYLKAESAYSALKRNDPACAAMMGYVGHADDKKHPPLQIADLLAHEARHHCAHMLDDSDKQRHTFRQLTDAHAFYYIGIIGKNGLLSQLAEYPDL